MGTRDGSLAARYSMLLGSPGSLITSSGGLELSLSVVSSEAERDRYRDLASVVAAEELGSALETTWKPPGFGDALRFAIEQRLGATFGNGQHEDGRSFTGRRSEQFSEPEGGEVDRGRARPALTESQIGKLCEELQLGYRWVPWRPLVPWWDVEYQPENPGQLVLLAPLAKMSSGSSPARSLPSSFLGETPSDNKCIIVQSRGQRARVRGTLAARSAASTARSEGELTRGGAFRDAGHMVRMDLARSGPCLPVGATCSQRFAYEWDEVGRLSRARRWDTAPGASIDDPLPGGTPAADLRYTYDAGDQRVIKHAVDTSGESFTLYVFASLELKRSQFGTAFSDGGSGPADYEVSVFTVVPYLLASGVRLARLAYEGTSEVPEVSPGTGAGQVNASVSQVHVFFELGDHLGSTSVVLDKATSELVERSTFQGYGATESDYRPGRWNAFREDYKFTGKEEDAEVGLMYFGKRYLNAYLGRWISADPLAIHAPGEADLNVYAYVRGLILKNVDPLGLSDVEGGGACANQSCADENGNEVVASEDSTPSGEVCSSAGSMCLNDGSYLAGFDGADALSRMRPEAERIVEQERQQSMSSSEKWTESRRQQMIQAARLTGAAYRQLQEIATRKELIDSGEMSVGGASGVSSGDPDSGSQGPSGMRPNDGGGAYVDRPAIASSLVTDRYFAEVTVSGTVKSATGFQTEVGLSSRYGGSLVLRWGIPVGLGGPQVGMAFNVAGGLVGTTSTSWSGGWHNVSGGISVDSTGSIVGGAASYGWDLIKLGNRAPNAHVMLPEISGEIHVPLTLPID